MSFWLFTLTEISKDQVPFFLRCKRDEEFRVIILFFLHFSMVLDMDTDFRLFIFTVNVRVLKFSKDVLCHDRSGSTSQWTSSGSRDVLSFSGRTLRMCLGLTWGA